MFKKIVALVLVFALSISIVSSAFASEITDFSEDALMVSEEFEAQYPSGAFSLSAVAMETNESSGRSVINVIRQGGTVGNISVTLKSIDVSTKYGQDYSLAIPGFIFDKKIKGNGTTPAAISVIEYDEVSLVGEEETGAATTPAAISVIEVPKSFGLKETRQQATGNTSDREKLAFPDSEESEQINTATAAANSFYAEAPGAVFNLSFADGERVKSFNLDIINDNIPEAQEQLVFVITEVSAGGFIGLQKETTVNIIDDEPYEMPVFGFTSHSFTADGETARITLTRTAGINYYAGASISTFGDSAQPGTDYTELGQKILFVPGQTELSLEIPIVKNESGVDKYFCVKLEPDKACTLSGDEVVQVLIPKEGKIPKTLLMSGSSLELVPDGVMLGVSKETIGYKSLIYASGTSGAYQFIHGSGWNEVNIKGKGAYGTLKTPKNYYMGNLESVNATFELFDLGHGGKYNAAEVFGRLNSPWHFFHSTQLAYGKNKDQVTTDDTAHKLTKQMYGRGWNLDKCYDSMELQLHVYTPLKSDKAALRAFSVEVDFRKFEFDVQFPQQIKEYIFDFSKITNNFTSEYVRPGEIEITTVGNQPMKGFYTSNDVTSFKVKTKNVREGYHLTGVKFLKNYDFAAAQKPENYYLFNVTNTDTITIDPTWLLNKADTFSLGGKFIIQPVFERNKSTLTVSMDENEKNKGEIVNVINARTPSRTFNTIKIIKPDESEETVQLYVNDKVILTGSGNNGSMIAGYNVSYNDGVTKSESGISDAGIHTITLTEKVSVSPIFGDQILNIKRDPNNKEQYSNIQGKIIYGTQNTTGDGQLSGIRSGQVVDFVSIPPEGYTTQWVNRTGDTNGNGILDYNEIHDPQTGKLYRQFDYDVDGKLDAEFNTTVYGDLFSYKVNQPNPLIYYYYVPMAGQTTFSNKVSGSVVTREWTIKQKYTQFKNTNGEYVDLLVPVVAATVKMGGSYDRNNPKAQIGYGTSTDNFGSFEFNVANLIKNANYLLNVEYSGVAYIDNINLSASKQIILPTFTSMKPISIDAMPRGGKDLNVVSDSIVMLKDKTVDFTLKTASLEPNVRVDKAIFRIYSSEGTLVSQKTETVTMNQSVFSANLNSAFIPNARLTVQLVDQTGNQSMEYNSGFKFRPQMQATSLLPSFVTPYQKTLPIIESVMGVLDLGLARFTNMTVNDDGYTLYIGVGHQFDEKSKELKNTIDEAEKGGTSGNAAKKKIKDENKDAPKKEGSNLKVKSTLTNNLGVKVSLEMNIKYDDDRDPKLGSPYYFGHLMLMVTLEDKFESETRVVLPIGLSVILKLGIGGSVTGYIYITPYTPLGEVKPIKVYADQYGNYPYYKADLNDPERKFVVEGGVILEPYISLSVGAEYGIAEVAVEGKALFHLNFSTSHSGSGTVTLTANVTVTVLGYEVYGKEFENWSTSLFGTSSGFMSQMLDSEALNQSDFECIPRDYLNNRSAWSGEILNVENPGPTMTDFTEKTLMQGIYPSPDSQLMRIDEDSLLLVFIDDDVGKSAKNRGTVYYSISYDNGVTFSQPVVIDSDGTLDSKPRLKDVGNKIICLYSSLDRSITDEMSMEDILESNSLEMAVFDKSTCQFAKPTHVTLYTGRVNPTDVSTLLGDYYSDVDGNVVYDETSGQVFIFYTKTDYTSDLDEDLKATDLFDSYGTIAYMIYDTNTGSFLPYSESDYPVGLTTEAAIQWDHDWYGQRFLDTKIIDASLPDGVLLDPLVFDLTTEEKNGTAYIAYTVDLDGNMETLEDRDVYLQTYSFIAKTFSTPLKVSDLQKDIQPKVDGKPKLVLYNGNMYLFFNADTAIYYYDLDNLFTELSTMVPEAIKGEAGYQSLAPGIALDYSTSNLPSDDYQVLVGDDGKLYLIWTEETIRLEAGVEPGSPEASEPQNVYHENQIYASVLYEKTIPESVDKDTIIFDNDYGKWSEKVQITTGPGSYSNSGVSIMANGKIIIAAKKSEKILLDNTEASPRVDNPNNAELVTLTLTPMSQVEMKKDCISFDTEYPIPNEITAIKATVNNHGLMPFLDSVVDFYAVQGETETYIGSSNGSTPIYGGFQSTFGIRWVVPEEIKNIKIVAKLRSGSSGTVVAQSEKAFPYGTKLEYGLFDVEYMAKNYYRTYIEVHHKGNQKLENAELIINRIDADNNPHELKRVRIDNETANLDMFIINEGFEIPKRDLREGCADIEVRIEVDDNLLVKQTVEVQKNLPTLYQELIGAVTSVELPIPELTLTRGTKSIINAKVYPVEVDQKNSIVYVSSNPAVATVNDVGEITGLMNGSATITAYAVPKVDVSMQTNDGHIVNGNILDTLALEDCKRDAVTVTVMNNSSSGTSIPLEVEVPDSVDIYANSDKSVSIKENGYTIVLGPKAISELLNGAKSEKLTLVITKLETTEKVQMYAISLKCGDTQVTRLNDADVKISIPYTLKENENPNAVVVYSITGSGELKAITNGIYKDGIVTFSTSDLTKFGIGHNLRVFTDVAKTAWYADAVTFIAARGIAEGIGDNQFAPEKLMTREEFARFIVSAFGFSWSGKKTGFNDVAQGSWYEQYVGALYEAGIISGIGIGKFGTKQYITRQDMAKILHAALQKKGITLNKTRDYTGFKDDSNIAEYAVSAIKALYEAGIISGMGNNKLNPTANAPRSNMAAVIKKILEMN